MLDWGEAGTEHDVLWRALRPTRASSKGGVVIFEVPFRAQRHNDVQPDGNIPPATHSVHVRAYGRSLRLFVDFTGQTMTDDSPMLELAEDAKPSSLSVESSEEGWRVFDTEGTLRMRVPRTDAPVRPWNGAEMVPPVREFEAVFYPDGATEVPMMSHDHFNPPRPDSIALGYVERAGTPVRALFSFHAAAGETFAGTGERFAKMDLSGRTLILENTDGLGVNSRRAYKNVPFYLSSRPYGLFMHSSSHIRLSLADISTRAAQGMIEEGRLDVFVIGGGGAAEIVRAYQGLTGFPHDVPPLWSFGVWMSRMTYFSADEIRAIAARLREEDFPCDVLHLDTGWFAKDWVCEWEFGADNFPDPAGFAAEMRGRGYRMTLWQNPNIGKGNKLLETALERGFLAPKRGESRGSEFSEQELAGQIDFSNPEAVAWYQGMLKRLLDMGYAAIKTDFGEDIDMGVDYRGLPAEKLHNLYGLLYQKAAYEITRETTGEGLVWARAGWAGCQRYPLHWGGDAACTWDGMAGSLRGGLHLGLSGYAFWSHDVPGFHGVPNFMASWPSDELYVRWTQFGVFTSHLRYHGTTPREPYEYPKVADIVRKWLKLRYALIPYILDESRKAAAGGAPVLQAMLLRHERDSVCRHIDDQYYFGEAFLVAPVMNRHGARDVYLPDGSWIDVWTGETLPGGRWMSVASDLERMPLYVKDGTTIRVYPHSVACTDDMELTKAVDLHFDGGYAGLTNSPLGAVTGFR